MSAKILLLGSTGFVGTNVKQVLSQEGGEVMEASASLGADLRNVEAASALMKARRPEIIVNCAAHVGSLNFVTEQAADVIDENARMILGIYAAIARNCPEALVINPIANCAYPGNAETYEEDRWQDGRLHHSVVSYGATRRFLWATAECYRMQHGVSSINLLVPNMYGPHDSTDPNKAHALNALISKFVKARRSGENRVDVWGTGIAIREWLYAADFGKIVREIIKRRSTVGFAEPVNVAQNFGYSVRDLVELIREAYGYEGEIVWDHSKPDGAPKKVMDDRRFRKLFPDFEFTPFEVGIASAVDYYESRWPYSDS